MNPKFLFLLSVIALPVLFWLSNNAAEQVMSKNSDAEEVSTRDCQFGEDVCEVSIEGENYLISVVNDFSAGQAIQLEFMSKTNAESSAKALQGIHLLLQGKTMYMGISETHLQYVDGKWVGLLRIPFCTTEVMRWQLDMTMTNEQGKQFVARYEFDMEHGNSN